MYFFPLFILILVSSKVASSHNERVLWFHHCQYVTVSIGKRVFSKTTHMIFLKLFMKLGCLNPLSTIFTKWSNTLKQFVSNLPTNCMSVFDHFVGFVLKGLRVKKWWSWIFWKKSQSGDNGQKHLKNRGFFGCYKKKIKCPLMCRFFGFKLCTIMTFMIQLKPHVWKKSCSWVKCKNYLGQSDCRIFKL